MLVKLLLSGIMAIIFGYVSGFIISKTSSVNNLPDECKSWNKNFAMEKSLFLVGIMMSVFYMKFDFLL